MNPESLLHATAQQLTSEASRGPGLMFLINLDGSFTVTRTPKPEQVKDIIAKYKCEEWLKGLTPPQYANLLKKLWSVYKPQAGDPDSGQQPAKKP